MNRREQGTKNLELARRFLHRIMKNPAVLDSIRPGGTVVLMPGDDDELAAANAAMAHSIGRDAVQVVLEENETGEESGAPAPHSKSA